MASNQSNRLDWRIMAVIVGGILLVGGIAAIGGFIAVERIRYQVGNLHADPQPAFQKSQHIRFHLTEAIEEGFAYLVSRDEGEKREFLRWADGFGEELAELERLIDQTQPAAEEERVLLERLGQGQEELAVAAKRLFADFERTGAVDSAAFHNYEEIVDRVIDYTRDLNDLGLIRLHEDRAEMAATLNDSQTIVLIAAALAALSALVVAAFVLYVFRRERTAREDAENIYRDFYDRSPDMQISVDGESGTIVDCNLTTTEKLGYDRSQILGKPVLKFYDPGCLAEATRCLKVFRSTGVASADHLQFVTSSGELLDVSLRVTAIRDKHGRILRSRSVCRDIRAQIQTERALKAGETSYRNLVESAPICIHEIDTDGKLIDMNAAGLAMVGQVDPASIAGVPYLDFVQAADKDRIAALMKGALEGQSAEFEFTSGSTPVRNFQSSFVPIRDHEGKVVRLMGVTQDLTDRRESERALRQKHKMAAVGQLAGGIAHDFNNLLTVIIGYCEELENSLDAESREFQCVSQVSIAATRAASLTTQLLAFSRNQERTPVILQLNEVIRDLERMLQRLIGEDVTLETKLDADLGRIEADGGQIEQIMVNLAANARDAMPTGGTLRIETQSVDSGRRARLSVSDTGKGIEPEIHDRIFEPFYSTKETGTGLGLATVLGIVEQNVGTIQIDSKVGRGTRVAIDFPRVMGKCLVPTPRVSGSGAASSTGTETVLLVEDQGPVRRMTGDVLRGRGYRVLEAENGLEALTVAHAHPGTVDILVTDVVMPKMGGAELCKDLLELIPDLKVVFVSGYVGEGERQDIPEDAVLVAKPYVPSELASVIRSALDGAVRLS